MLFLVPSHSLFPLITLSFLSLIIFHLASMFSTVFRYQWLKNKISILEARYHLIKSEHRDIIQSLQILDDEKNIQDEIEITVRYRGYVHTILIPKNKTLNAFKKFITKDINLIGEHCYYIYRSYEDVLPSKLSTELDSQSMTELNIRDHDTIMIIQQHHVSASLDSPLPSRDSPVESFKSNRIVVLCHDAEERIALLWEVSSFLVFDIRGYLKEVMTDRLLGLFNQVCEFVEQIQSCITNELQECTEALENYSE